MPSLVERRPPGVVVTPPVLYSTPPVVDSRPPFLKFPAFTGRMQESDRRREASGRRRQAFFRCQKAVGRRAGIVNFETGSLQSPSQGFHTPAQTVRSITSLDHSCDRCVRFVRRTCHRRPRACGRNDLAVRKRNQAMKLSHVLDHTAPYLSNAMPGDWWRKRIDRGIVFSCDCCWYAPP